MDFTDLYFTK